MRKHTIIAVIVGLTAIGGLLCTGSALAADPSAQDDRTVVTPQIKVPPVRTPEAVQEGRSEADRRFGPDAANVRVEVTFTYQIGNGAPIRRTAMLTMAEGGTASLRAGNQVAVPQTTFVSQTVKGTADTPMTSFNYRSVGLNLDARQPSVSGNRVRVTLSVEASTIEEKADANRPPTFPTFTQNFTLVLENGKPIVVAQSSDVVDNVERKQSVEVKATIIR